MTRFFSLGLFLLVSACAGNEKVVTSRSSMPVWSIDDTLRFRDEPTKFNFLELDKGAKEVSFVLVLVPTALTPAEAFAWLERFGMRAATMKEATGAISSGEDFEGHPVLVEGDLTVSTTTYRTLFVFEQDSTQPREAAKARMAGTLVPGSFLFAVLNEKQSS